MSEWISGKDRLPEDAIKEDVLGKLRMIIYELESTDMRTVNRGKWLDWMGDSKCSICGGTVEWDEGMNYCPFCGAKMEGDEE